MTRDLYRLLGVSRDASTTEIEERLEHMADPDAAGEIRAILDDPDRRAAYDHCHAALCLIGQLRADLRLTRTAHWSGREFADFCPDQGPMTRLPRPVSGPGRSSCRGQGRQTAGLVLFLMGLMFGITCMGTWLITVD